MSCHLITTCHNVDNRGLHRYVQEMVRYRPCTCDDTVSGTVQYSSGLMYLHFHTPLLKQVLTQMKRIRTGQMKSGTGILLFGMLKRIILVNNQLDALFSMYLFISLLYMFQATQCSSSGESNCINTSSGISPCVGDCLVCRSGRT
jgi:hypothetical protein